MLITHLLELAELNHQYTRIIELLFLTLRREKLSNRL